jgi:lactate dehydrogenase-like 2-hydroxyacid dehydrogenase
MANLPSTSPAKERIVCLDECHCEIPAFNVLHTYTGHNNTSPELVADRIKDATIIITTRVPLSADVLEQCSPELRLIAVMAAGYDIIDLKACRKLGITVCNIPSASAEAVAEHAITLYLSVKRRVVELHALTKQGEEWPLKKTAIHRYGGLPRTCRSESMGIIGYGTLGESCGIFIYGNPELIFSGQRTATIAKALGMTVIVSERKGASPTTTRPGRNEFYEMLEKSDVVVLCCPLDA